MCAVAISSDGKRMVTCGVRHVKFWSLESLGTDRVRREAGYSPVDDNLETLTVVRVFATAHDPRCATWNHGSV